MSQINANNNGNEITGLSSTFTGNAFSPLQEQGGSNNVEDSLFNINNSLDNDEDFKATESEASTGIGNYQVNRPIISCDKFDKIQEFKDTVGANALRPLKDGYGISVCNVDVDSKYRIGVPNPNPKNVNQLFTRPYLTVPYMANGNLSTERMDIESELITGDYEMDTLPLAGVSLFEDHVFVPLTRNLKDNVQNPVHLIEESADRVVPNNYRDAWIRGGIPTRQEVKDVDYLERSGDNEYVKQLLLQKKGYLFS
jgi:hypothetical protein